MRLTVIPPHKKMSVRAAGLRAEKKFFGPRGVFAKSMKRRASGNPKGSKWEPPRPWDTIAESTSTGDQFMLSGDGNVYALTLSGWVNHGTLKEFTAHAPAQWKPLRWISVKKNPITVVGNPPARINTTIAGVLYNRCVEIRAEKTGNSSLRGLYYHPFMERSKVMVLALDSGDILIHSSVGEHLWKLD